MRRKSSKFRTGLPLKSTDSEKVWLIIGPTVERIIARCKHKYVFAYFDEDDIAQEIKLIAIQAYQKYNKSRGPLENFLARSISNRIKVNLKRDHGFIVQIPCITYKCFFYDKKNKCCKWDNTKCLDWKRYTKTYSYKTAVASPSLYPDEEMIVSTNADPQVHMHLEEMLQLARKRDLKCAKAIEHFIRFGQEISAEHSEEIQSLVSEVV